MRTKRSNKNGFAMVTVLMLIALLGSMLLAYFALTEMEINATRLSMESTAGYYAAEAGLNIRSETIRQAFLDYRRPTGESPAEDGSPVCDAGNNGTDDFRCLTAQLESHSITTYVREAAENPNAIIVPRGERFQNLHAQVYDYSISSRALGTDAATATALLELELESRLVPMFQFAAFYGKDLEILPGPAMMLAGPVHTNGDLYVNALESLELLGPVTSAGDLYRGRKALDECDDTHIGVVDASTTTVALPQCTGRRRQIGQPSLDALGALVETGINPLTVPGAGDLDPNPGEPYWDNADLRLALDITIDPPVVWVVGADGSPDFIATSNLKDCGAVDYSRALYNFREDATIRMMNVNLRELFDCANNAFILEKGKRLDDATHGGLVFHLTVQGPRSTTVNDYGVRVYNGEQLAATNALAPEPRGLTVVSDQAIYIEGDFNSVEKRPAAILGDSINVLSNAWNDDNSTLEDLDQRRAENTIINAAFLGGTDSTGGVEGEGGRDDGKYNGGLENYPRLHETWTGRTLTYRGSFVSLHTPRHVDGLWELSSYDPPRRDWNYDLDFNNAANLPPMTPRFVYMRQTMFVRKFDF